MLKKKYRLSARMKIDDVMIMELLTGDDELEVKYVLKKFSGKNQRGLHTFICVV